MDGDPLHPVAATATLTPAELPRSPKRRPVETLLTPGTVRMLRVVVVVGALVTALGWLFARSHAAAGILIASQFVLGVGVGGLAFVALSYVTKAGWSVALRRIPEAMAATLPVGGACVLIALASVGTLYAWSQPEAAQDPLLDGKRGWLADGAFLLRAVLYLALWSGFAFVIRRVSRRQDETHAVRQTHWNVRLSAAFLVVFAFTFSFAMFDWLMSLEPHWYSTVYAIYNFASLFLSALAMLTLAAIGLRRLGPYRTIVSDDHLHDLGKLMFAFATFWAYIWFCQYMLIWYSNIPEETSHYMARRDGVWGVLMFANPVLNWLIPFLALLPRPAKRSESTLVKVALVLLVGRWLDLHVLVSPSVTPDAPWIGLWDLAPLACFLALVTLAFFRMLGRTHLVPRGDPMLEESLHHHT